MTSVTSVTFRRQIYVAITIASGSPKGFPQRDFPKGINNFLLVPAELLWIDRGTNALRLSSAAGVADAACRALCVSSAWAPI